MVSSGPLKESDIRRVFEAQADREMVKAKRYLWL